MKDSNNTVGGVQKGNTKVSFFSFFSSNVIIC